MNTIKNIKKIEQYQIKAFTLLETLLTLAMTSFLVFALSGSVESSFKQVEQRLFFLEFEHMYQETQQLSVASQSPYDLNIGQDKISNGLEQINVPKEIETTSQVISFDKAGGNSTLKKIIFKTKDKQVSYQLYIGNGKFKKTES